MKKFYTNVMRFKDHIIHSGYENGKKFTKEFPFEPWLGYKTPKPTGFKDIYGNHVEKKHFDTISEFVKFRKEHGDVLDLYDNIDPIYQFIAEEYPTEEIPDLSIIRSLYYDIEVYCTKGFPDPEKADWPVTAISTKDSKTNKIVLFGIQDFNPKKMEIEVIGEVEYVQCLDEKDLLKQFLEYVYSLEPDVITGWNISNFDTPYLIERITKVIGEGATRKLCIVGKPSYTVNNFMGRKEIDVRLPGIAHLDYLEMYKKRMTNKEAYNLNFIASDELEKEKVDLDEDTLNTLYETNIQKFYEYSIYDSELVWLLDQKLGLINVQLSLAYLHKCNFEDMFSPVRSWDTLIFNYLHKKNIMIPPPVKGDKHEYVGAYVKDIEPAIYNWIMSYDVNSLYPHVIIQYNISPETIMNLEPLQFRKDYPDEKLLVGYNHTENNILTANGERFSRQKEGFAPELMRYIYNSRKDDQKKMRQYEKELEELKISGASKLKILDCKRKISSYHNSQLAKKISINSFYGAYANRFFRYYDIRLAEAITLTGQLTIIWMQNKLNEFFEQKYGYKNTVIYSDTDSLYLTFNKMVESVKKKKPDITTDKIVTFLDSYNKQYVEPFINEQYLALAETMNCKENVMVMKREVIAEYGMWKGKKHYALLVWDSEGNRYPTAKLKVKGMKIVQSSTPKAVKNYLRESIIYLMKSPDDLKEYCNKVRELFMKMSPEDISFPRQVNNLRKYTDKDKIFGKGCPIAVRGALVHNQYIKDNNINVQPIGEANKIKYIHCFVPNPYYNSNIVGFSTKFIYDKKYIDYNTQFQKAFYETVEDLAKSVGVDISGQQSLEDLF